jgi:hypothetical protein
VFAFARATMTFLGVGESLGLRYLLRIRALKLLRMCTDEEVGLQKKCTVFV